MIFKKLKELVSCPDDFCLIVVLAPYGTALLWAVSKRIWASANFKAGPGSITTDWASATTMPKALTGTLKAECKVLACYCRS